MIAKFACFVHPNTVPFSVFSAMACNGQGLKRVEDFLPASSAIQRIPMACTRYRNTQTSSGLKQSCFVMNTAQGGHNLSISPVKLIRDEV